MKAVRAVLLSLLLVLVAGPVLAHTELVSAVPAPGATVSGLVTDLSLTFTEPLAAGSHVQLFADAFRVVPGVNTSVAANVLSAHLAEPLAPRTYTVQWVALGADGHPVAGSYQFAVAAPSAVPWWPWVLAVVIVLGAAAIALLWLRRRPSSRPVL